MPRPTLPPFLLPRRPGTVLGWTMQKQRIVYGWSIKETAGASGVDRTIVTRVEHGKKTPTADLVRFYDETFGGEGLCWSLFAVIDPHRSRPKKPGMGRWPKLYKGAVGDSSDFVRDTVPHGTMMRPGEVFWKSWTIRNTGTVAWTDRVLERQGPRTGPGLITSPPSIPIPATQPGQEVTIISPLKAPTYDCASIAYFKMAEQDGRLSFPDNYTLGLDVLVLVRGQAPDLPSDVQADPEDPALVNL